MYDRDLCAALGWDSSGAEWFFRSPNPAHKGSQLSTSIRTATATE